MSTIVTDADRGAFLAVLADADESGGIEVAHALLDRGVPAESILLDLIAPCQHTVGDLWADATWSIAQEHAATHVSEQVVAAVAARTPKPAAPRGTIVVACVDGEWHALPAKLFAEVVRLHGWQVRFLGASVPGPHLISYLHQHGPDALAVSCSLPTRLVTAHRIIEAAQEASIPVLAGGAGFGPDARWGRRLGADRVAATVTEALAVLDEWPPPITLPLGEVHEWYAVDDEHTLVTKRRAELADLGAAALGAASGTTRDGLEQIVDFLAAGLFVDDLDLFLGFIDWMGVILGTRGIERSTMDSVLGAFQSALYDFPRALRHLDAGRSRLCR